LFDLDKTATIRQKMTVLMSAAGPANVFGKIGIAQKQGMPIVKTFY
jgi:hypothetical protein